MNIWPEFGFSQSLYATTPIRGTPEGRSLLVGRAEELRELKTILQSTALHPTIEGENGVGKTSLVAVAGYELRRTFVLGNDSKALIPIESSLQLTPEDTVAGFRRKVLFEIARAFIDAADELRQGGYEVPNTSDVRRWLSRAVQGQSGMGISAAGFGGSVSRASSPNTSAGFSEAGFASEIESWLRQTFPTAEHGGFLCIIDNLELLGTLQAARQLLESMRDSVLGLQGIRWVLCGSRGIVRTVVSSSRLEGRLATPMLLGALPDTEVAEVVSARQRQYKIRDDAVAPVGHRGFRHLYDVLNRNLRNALKYADDFALWLYMHESPPWNRENVSRLLEVWLTDIADAHASETRIGRAAWAVFDGLIEMGGACSPSDHESFGYDTPMALRPQVKALEDVNLVASSVDESDKRRKTISVTPRGWLVNYARSGYSMPSRIHSR